MSKKNLFDGSGDYLSVPDSADFDFDGSDFTITGWRDKKGKHHSVFESIKPGKRKIKRTDMEPKKDKPLFIPLMSKHYEAFERGDKFEEYRLYGPRWNEKTCKAGRPVVLSKGYGKKHRMTGTVLGFSTSLVVTYRPEWKEIYGKQGPAAVIMIGLDKDYEQGGDSDNEAN